MLICFLALSNSELPHNMTLFVFAPHHIFVDHQPLKPYGTPCMYLACADAYLCAETVSETVCETGASVDKCPSRVDTTTELEPIRF